MPRARRPFASLVLLAACAAGPGRVEPIDRVLADALDDVQYRGAPARAAAGLRLARTRFGSVLVVAPVATGTRDDDTALEAAVRAALAADPLLAGRDIDVDVDGGRVRLEGLLGDAAVAARAVRRAARVPGVLAVESRLAWVRPDDARLARRRPPARPRSAE